ncbi:MAG: cobyric acid synthase [Bacteroidetes bacterium]|nr:cobyric acid synthase [Bacteroidota bacterium]
MFVGTGSDVGKSVINAAFCRIFRQDGYHPAPFKGQNMSLNSFATSEGLEIGRAQAMQAEAAGVPCHSTMNPVLLKPTNDKSAQIVLNGKPMGNQTAHEYFVSTDRQALFDEVMKGYRYLAERYNPIVMEGAGSISEINLWDKDITNMRVAVETQAAVILIADIDRGGIFGSVYGTLQLLPPEQRKLIKGILINKFRGDASLFESGKKQLEALTGVPVVGVLPYFKDIYLDEEDSVGLPGKNQQGREGAINIAIVLLRHMSNFTDFNVLERWPGVHLFYAANPGDLNQADIIFIPGSKNTISDLQYLRNRGMAKAILEGHQAGKAVYGICGGYQMMGENIQDPLHVEGSIDSTPGLGLLPVETILSGEKKTVQCEFKFRNNNEKCTGYEIHMGETKASSASPLCKLNNGDHDGFYLNDKTWGTYIHGILDNPSVIKHILAPFNKEETSGSFNIRAFKQEQYDKLAQFTRQYVDMDYIYRVLRKKEPTP